MFVAPVTPVDSSDPVGPAATLFTSDFYQSMSDSLSPNGVICTQGECQWLHVDFIKEVIERAREIFPSVQYAYSTVPSYPSGQLGFIVAAKEAAVDLSGLISCSSPSKCFLNFR